MEKKFKNGLDPINAARDLIARRAKPCKHDWWLDECSKHWDILRCNKCGEVRKVCTSE